METSHRLCKEMNPLLSTSIPKESSQQSKLSRRMTISTHTPTKEKLQHPILSRSISNDKHLVKKRTFSMNTTRLKILNNVVAMVDVYAGEDNLINCSEIIASKLNELGAKIIRRFTPKVTHLVVNEFTDVWKEKIMKWQSIKQLHSDYVNIHIVSQLWVNECYLTKSYVKETIYFPVSKNIINPSLNLFVKGSNTPFKQRQVSIITPETRDGVQEKQIENVQLATRNTLVLSAKKMKRRALSMEPMASHTIAQKLGSHCPLNTIPSQNIDGNDINVSTVSDVPIEEKKRGRPQAPINVVNCVATKDKEAESKDIGKTLTKDKGKGNEVVVMKTVVKRAAKVPESVLNSSMAIFALDDPTEKSLRRQSGTRKSLGSVPKQRRSARKSISSFPVRRNNEMSLDFEPEQLRDAHRGNSKAKNQKGTGALEFIEQRHSLDDSNGIVDRLSTKRRLNVHAFEKNQLTPAKKLRLTEEKSMEQTATPNKSRYTEDMEKENETLFQTPRKKNELVNMNYTPGFTSPLNRSNGFKQNQNMKSPNSLLSMQAITRTPSKTIAKQRAVIGITGTDIETREVLECAIHAIDANTSLKDGFRKSRVIKSLDHCAAVTHLIVGNSARRTLKVLFAIAKGAWIVSESWVFHSLEQEKWLNEESFEVPMYANRYARLNPKDRGIFQSMRFYVGSNMDPSRELLQSLIRCAGGECCNKLSQADICISSEQTLFKRAERHGICAVTPKWVFDSIACMNREDQTNYGIDTINFVRVPDSQGQ